ncbi:kallikrein-5-like [Tachyglossus aculeatus]|uniref:kallikrein-5-like n=1 Tax=Tachyglossus aculeatus TaxID=9261 RepID=UPI0018F75669|nr:kallikrein-5-like [Tachyglossus aculeatus]
MAGAVTVATWLLTTAMILISTEGREEIRIINGTECPRHSHPWQVVLFLGQRLYCGAVLVHRQWLLTAAHCRKPSYLVQLGRHRLQEMELTTQLRKGILTIPHPKYSHPKHDNDLMLIKLGQPVRLTADVKPIGLSSRCPSAGTRCLASGWGTTRSPQVSYPKALQCVNITILSKEACQAAYPGMITESMLCAGDRTGKDSCQGDSGGPLVCDGTLQGLVSWGDFPCAKPNRPGVYTKLCLFTKWIQDTIKSH